MSTDSSSKIGVSTATIIGMNAMIGAGIFTAPAALASNVGPAGILAYIFVVIAVWFLAQSLARLAGLYPEEGAFYVYAQQWGGHVMGMIASWTYFTGLLIAMGLLSQVAGFYLQPFFPQFSPYALGLCTLIALTLLNMFGVALSELGQQILIVCTTFPIIATTIMCLTKVDTNLLVPFAPYGMRNVFQATRAVIFGFFGFECAASLFAIVKDPQKNVPRALTYSIILVGTLYTLFVASLILSTPLELFVSSSIRIPDILQMTFTDKPWLITAIHISILSAVLGTIHSMIWSSSALLISLMKKVKNNTVKTLLNNNIINAKTSVLLVGLCIFISFSSINKIDLFFSLTAVFIVCAYLLSIITLLTLRAEWESGQNIKTLIGIVAALTILYFALEGLVLEIAKLV